MSPHAATGLNFKAYLSNETPSKNPKSMPSFTERGVQADLPSIEQLTSMSATLSVNPVPEEEDSSTQNLDPESQNSEDTLAYPEHMYTSAEMDAKLQELDHDLRRDMVSTFEEFEKVLKRTRHELAEERFARRELEDDVAMRVNQLQAMVDEVAPSVGPWRRGAISARRNTRAERQRQQWEGLLRRS